MYKIIRTSTVPLSLNLFCRGLLRELSSDYEVVALSSPQPELEDIALREGVRTVAVPMRREIAPFGDMVSLWRLVRVFRGERPQMVHSITPKAGLLSMVAGRIAGVPVRVHTFTGLVFPSSSGLRRRLLMLTDKITCMCATHIVAEGRGVKDDLLQYGITRKEVSVLGFGNLRGIDLDHYLRTPEVEAAAADIRARAGIGDDSFTFVFTGRIVRDKGMDELADAFVRLRSEGYDIRLLIAGSREASGSLSARTLKIMEESAGIYASEGWVDDVRPWYAAADALVFPSYREGFPNAVIEAGAMGLPSIVTDINGSREIIIDGRNGIIVPPRDADALYAAMKSMADDPRRAKAMGGEARPLVASRYEQGFVRAKLKEFYREVLK